MITWLASYPRSGNTFLRTILRSNFDLSSYSLYDDPTDVARTAEFREAAGHKSHGLVQEDFYERARKSSDTLFVKTHDLPVDDAKAIYVVRDGRSAVVSYFHYFKNFTQEKVALEDVIAGACNFGSWSNHITQWAPQTRPNTLLVRYEDFVLQPANAIDRIAQFIGRVPKNHTPPDFSALNAINSSFFRSGSNERNISELNGADLELFWLLHHQTMGALGYEIAKPELSAALANRLTTRFSDLKAKSDRVAELENACRIGKAQRDQLEAQRDQLEAQRDQLKAQSGQFEALINTIETSGWWRLGRKLKLV